MNTRNYSYVVRNLYTNDIRNEEISLPDVLNIQEVHKDIINTTKYGEEEVDSISFKGKEIFNLKKGFCEKNNG